MMVNEQQISLLKGSDSRKQPSKKPLIIVSLFTIILLAGLALVIVSSKVPKVPSLSTSNSAGRFIVNERGERLKLQCVSWPSHLETMLPEGLYLQSVENLARLVKNLKFNCVRFTYAIDFTRQFYNTSGRVAVNLASLPTQMISSIDKVNPGLLDLSLFEIYLRVIQGLKQGNEAIL